MKRFLLINPNSTAEMTASVLAVARAAAPAGVAIDGITNITAPPAIEGPEDGDAATPGLLALIAANPDYDGYLIACFDDTALEEARGLTQRPVAGIGEASFLAAARLGAFSVVTTVAAAEPVILSNIQRVGLAEACREVRAAGIAVLDLEHHPAAAAAQVSAEIGRQSAAHGPAAVILGCAGMGGVLDRLTAPKGAVLVEPVAAGVAHLAELAG